MRLSFLEARNVGRFHATFVCLSWNMTIGYSNGDDMPLRGDNKN
jgi:hypothetical protein